MSDLILPYVPAAAHGGPFTVPVHIEVIHSTEGPMVAGNALALAGWFGRDEAHDGPGTSAHAIFDPAGGVAMVPLDHIAWHCGPGGNGFTRGDEHCGKVAMTREQWLSPAGQAMLDHSARHRAARLHASGGLPRWLTLTQLRAREPGMCTHNDIRLAFGGTTHSDPGPNFPYDWYLERVRHYYFGEDDVTPQELEDAVAAGVAKFARTRQLEGQPSLNESVFASDNLIRQAQTNGNGIGDLLTTTNNLVAAAADIKAVVDAVAAAVIPPAGR